MVKNNAWNFDTTFTIGDILYADSNSTLSKLGIGSEGQVLGSTGTLPQWKDAVFVPTDSQNFNFFEDYLGGSTGFNLFMTQNGFFQINGSAVVSQSNPGTYSLTTGTSSSQAANVGYFYKWLVFGGGTSTLNMYAKIPILSTSSQRFKVTIGYTDNSLPSSFTNGCWFEYTDNVNSGNWQIKTVKSSSSTTANTTTAADTNWHKFTIIINAAATSVAFYIDDVQLNTSPITTNIPTGSTEGVGAYFGILKLVGTTARTLQADWYDQTINLTNPRY